MATLTKKETFKQLKRARLLVASFAEEINYHHDLGIDYRTSSSADMMVNVWSFKSGLPTSVEGEYTWEGGFRRTLTDLEDLISILETILATGEFPNVK